MPQAVAAAIVSYVGATGVAATLITVGVQVAFSYGVSQLTKPNKPVQTQAQQRELQVVGGDSSDRLIYGLAKVGSTLFMAQTYGDYVYVGGVLCRHPIEEIVTIYFDDKPSTHPDFSDVELSSYDIGFFGADVATEAGVATLTIDGTDYTYDIEIGTTGAEVQAGLLSQLSSTSEIEFNQNTVRSNPDIQGLLPDDGSGPNYGYGITVTRVAGSVSGWDIAVSIDTEESTTGIRSTLTQTAGHAETQTQHRVLYSLGDHTEADATLVSELDYIDAPQRWTSEHKLLGCAWVNVRFPKAFIWDTLGRLPALSFVVRGHNGITDYRTGQVGYTTNPLLCFQHWASQVYGYSAGADLFNQDVWDAEANVCDEQLVINADGDTQDRYSFNTVIALDTPRGDVAQLFSDAVQAPVLDARGKFVIRPSRLRDSVATLTLDDLADGDIEYLHAPSNSGRFNELRGTFIDPAQGWSEHDYPPVVIDDGLAQQVGNLSFAAEIDGIRAQRLALLNLRLSRASAPLKLPIKRLDVDILEDDFVMLAMPEIGFDDVVFYVSQRVDNANATAVLTLLPRDESDYEWSYTDATEIQTVTPVPVFKNRDELS